MATVRQYSLESVREEVQALVARGLVGRHSRIYSLCRFFDYRAWLRVERLLEEHDYLLRDGVVDLIGPETWLND